MTMRFLLTLALLAPLLAAGCQGGDDPDRGGSRGPYVSGGFGGH